MNSMSRKVSALVLADTWKATYWYQCIGIGGTLFNSTMVFAGCVAAQTQLPNPTDDKGVGRALCDQCLAQD